jgi:large subunit ribosomal protein L25
MIFRLEASPRTVGKKSLNHELRKSGSIPAVIYGQGETGLPISLNKANFMKEYKRSIGELAFYTIVVEGKEYNTLIKEKQIHPVRRDIIHVDFMELHASTPIHVEVPIKLIGHPEALRAGGILEVGMRNLNITCLPSEIPEDITVDISQLGIGHSIHVKDLNTAGLQVKDAPDVTVASIHVPRGVKIETETNVAE